MDYSNMKDGTIKDKLRECRFRADSTVPFIRHLRFAGAEVRQLLEGGRRAKSATRFITRALSGQVMDGLSGDQLCLPCLVRLISRRALFNYDHIGGMYYATPSGYPACSVSGMEEPPTLDLSELLS